ncbi:MAG: hypothetical protein EP330_01045 [Deltaproteobacteria bacterium]|nr:MAG: hypothetical protein EP330_01045 [Deltaproteobacteria bacterium]
MLALATGCWNGEPSSLETGETDFAPGAGEIANWRVQTQEMDGLTCPDGSAAKVYIVFSTENATAQPAAVVLHSGALDWVLEPDATDPLAGDHFNDPNRLTLDFGAGKAFATLGMYPDADANEASNGAMALALAERGVTLVVPTNCWGDMWRNQAGGRDNDTTTDGFVRSGGEAAAWAWSLISEPGFPSANRITLPVEIDTTALFLVGLGEGGRGVTELLADGAVPTGAMVDSVADDLGPYYADTELYADIVVGLDRIFPDGQASVAAGSLGDDATPIPPRMAYVYSSLDGNLPASTHDAAIARLEADTTNAVLIQDTLGATHVATASDSAVAGLVADFLLDTGN